MRIITLVVVLMGPLVAQESGAEHGGIVDVDDSVTDDAARSLSRFRFRDSATGASLIPDEVLIDATDLTALVDPFGRIAVWLVNGDHTIMVRQEGYSQLFAIHTADGGESLVNILHLDPLAPFLSPNVDDSSDSYIDCSDESWDAPNAPRLPFSIDAKIAVTELIAAQVVPDTIRVGRGAYTGVFDSCTGYYAPCTRDFDACVGVVDVVSIQTYVGRVMRRELGVPQMINEPYIEQFKAFAVAIRSYGGYFVNNKIGSQYDICNSTRCQCYDAGAQAGPMMSQATADTANLFLVNGSNIIPMTEYSSWGDGVPPCSLYYIHPDVGCIYDDVLYINRANRPTSDIGHGHGMSQWGSYYRAQRGELYTTILNFYYSGYGWNVPTPATTFSVTVTYKALGLPVPNGTNVTWGPYTRQTTSGIAVFVNVPCETHDLSVSGFWVVDQSFGAYAPCGATQTAVECERGDCITQPLTAEAAAIEATAGAGFGFGDRVEVYNTGGIGLRAWNDICSNGYVVKPEGAQGLVVGEASVCCNGYDRWQIRWDGESVTRWSAEGDRATGDYWLRNVSTPAERTGACCNTSLHSPSCQVTEQSACLAANDGFGGRGTTCPSGCPCADDPRDCDWCWTGTNIENNCDASWQGDGECDCGCQFSDPDCQSACSESDCTTWAAGGCGAGSCSSTLRRFTRTCPAGCGYATQKCECDSSCGCGQVTDCSPPPDYEFCSESSSGNCDVSIAINLYTKVNDIRWGEVVDDFDPYVLGQYRIGWTDLDAEAIYYDCATNECEYGGCTCEELPGTGTRVTVVAPGTAHLDGILAYDHTADFGCLSGFLPFNPGYGTDPIYVLRCYNDDDCSPSRRCNKVGHWTTWACVEKSSDGAPCTQDDECQSGFCDNDGTGLADDGWCFTPFNTYFDGQEPNYCEYSTGVGSRNCDESPVGTPLHACFGLPYLEDRCSSTCNEEDIPGVFDCHDPGCACAEPRCDGLGPGDHIATCSNGLPYFADACSATAAGRDRGDDICRSSEFALGCTAASECDGVIAGSGNCSLSCQLPCRPNGICDPGEDSCSCAEDCPGCCRDSECDDGVFCNGEEFCDAVFNTCEHSGDRCGEYEVCVEETHECVQPCFVDYDYDGVCDNADACPFDAAPLGVDGAGRPLGDLDGDCDVDLDDFQVFHSKYGGPGMSFGCPIADLDGDCDVDLGDFQILQGNFSGSVIHLHFDPPSVLTFSETSVSVNVYVDVAGDGPFESISIVFGSDDLPLTGFVFDPTVFPCLPYSWVDLTSTTNSYTYEVLVDALSPPLPCSPSTPLLLGTLTISLPWNLGFGCFQVEVNHQRDHGWSGIWLNGSNRGLLGVLTVCRI